MTEPEFREIERGSRSWRHIENGTLQKSYIYESQAELVLNHFDYVRFASSLKVICFIDSKQTRVLIEKTSLEM